MRVSSLAAERLLNLRNAWFNFTCYHPPRRPSPGSPQDKSSLSGPGVGNCLKRSCPGGGGGGGGAGIIKNNFLCSIKVTSWLTRRRRTAWRGLPIARENL